MNLESKVQTLIEKADLDELEEKYIFLSLGKPNVKAQVKLLKNARYTKRDILKHCQNFKKKSGQLPEWVKLDVVTHTETVPFDTVKK